jgi:2-isopropylmalate synthase
MDQSAPHSIIAPHHRSPTAPPDGKYFDWGERFPFKLADRSWPDNVITQAPNWCSVDLRDGNQALPRPMTVEEKTEFFDLLANKIGFREIEVGYPTANDEEYAFLRRLIEENLIPDHVVPQILTMSRPNLFKRAFESLRGARSAIFHIYCPVSDDQIELFFKMSRHQILQKVIDDVTEVRKQAAQADFDVHLQFSPESATCGDVAFTKAVLHEVYRIWQPSPSRRLIFNIPDTVQVASGQGSHNRYGDMIEYLSRAFPKGDVELSLHTHNDQQLGIAAALNGLLAGAVRVEGTLFGNGERTGNCDVLVLAKYLFEMGIDPKISIKEIPAMKAIYERLTGMNVPPRHPLGDLAFTAFSGGHQAAIAAGLAHQESNPGSTWRVPYLSLDPQDVGLAYKPIRINSQSGKHGAAYCLKTDFGCEIPQEMFNEWSQRVKDWCDTHKAEIKPEEAWHLFERSYINPEGPLALKGYRTTSHPGRTHADVELAVDEGRTITISGVGNGPIDAVTHALGKIDQAVSVRSFKEHSRGEGSDAEAVAYVQVERDGKTTFGVGLASNIERASIQALIAGVNRLSSMA